MFLRWETAATGTRQQAPTSKELISVEHAISPVLREVKPVSENDNWHP
jgi:hypothetical protein